MRCKICKKKMKVLSWMHFKLHDLTVQEYFKLYPKEKIKYHEERSAHFKSIYKDNPELIDRRIKYMQSEKNPMKDPKVVEKNHCIENENHRKEAGKKYSGKNHPLYGVERTWMMGNNNWMCTERGRTLQSEKRKKWCEDHPYELLKQMKNAAKGIKPYDSKPERRVRKYASNLGYELFSQVEIVLGKHRYLLDILIPELKLVIEVNGCYHHACIDCHPYLDTEYIIKKWKYDRIRKETLENVGLKVITIWEHDVDSGKFKQLLKEVIA